MTLITGVVGLLSAVFLFAGPIKILGWQKRIFETQLGMFVRYGLSRRIMAPVGCVELFGAIAIWVRGAWMGTLGALALPATSLGAIGCHLIWDSWTQRVPAMVTGALSAMVAWSGRDTRLGLFGMS